MQPGSRWYPAPLPGMAILPPLVPPQPGQVIVGWEGEFGKYDFETQYELHAKLSTRSFSRCSMLQFSSRDLGSSNALDWV